MATTMTTSPLPALDSPRIQELRLSKTPNRYSAYNMILQAERHAVQQQAKEDIMSARVVGYLLLEFHAQCDIFGDSPCASLVKWVTSEPPQTRSTGDNEYDIIFDVGKLCRDKFIRLFRTSNAWYPPPSSRPSRPSFDTLEDMTQDSMERTDKDYKTSRRRALARDGYQCMITGMIDENSLGRCADLRAIYERGDVIKVTVETAHILNESTMQGTDPAGTSKDSAELNKTHYVTDAMAILECFGLSDLSEAFKRQGGVHEVWNLLSLQHDIHHKSDTLNLWFESTPQPGRYKVCVSDKSAERYIHLFAGPKPHVDGAPMVVEFMSQFEKAPLPHPLLLALHATCARVAHMSGVTQIFDQLEWDAEEIEVLALDGSSAPLLGNLMSPFAALEITS